MKKLAFTIALTFLTSSTFAATAQSNRSNFDIRVPVKNWLKKLNDGFRVGIAQGSLETNLRIRDTGLDNSNNEGSNTKIQLHLGHEEIRTKNFGHSIYATYQDVSIDNNIYDADLRNMRIAANATYGLTPQAYVYGGLNYGKWFGSGVIEDNIDAGIGHQLGIGVKLHKKINLEAEYLTLINEGRYQKRNLDLTARGILIKLNTPFSFNI
ncbi:MAG: outer membrane beta-barrel protein [Bacteriovoracaceae bacterium]|jgi:hypothetical protein|nr:outer membrane beta-barrel protein [Bacteriovoracaceae bacterium]